MKNKKYKLIIIMTFYSNYIEDEYFINNEISRLHYELHPSHSPIYKINQFKELFKTQFISIKKKMKCNKNDNKKSERILKQIKNLEKFNSSNDDFFFDLSQTNKNFFPTSLKDNKKDFSTSKGKINNIFLNDNKMKKNNSCDLLLNKDFPVKKINQKFIFLTKRNFNKKNLIKIGFVQPKNLFAKFEVDKTKLPFLNLKQYEMREYINFKNKEHPFKFK